MIRVTHARTRPPGPRARIPRAHEKGPHPPDLRRTRGPPALRRARAGHDPGGRRDHVDDLGSPGPALAGGAVLALRVPAHLPPAALPVLRRRAVRAVREPRRGQDDAGVALVAARPCPRPHRGGAVRGGGGPPRRGDRRLLPRGRLVLRPLLGGDVVLGAALVGLRAAARRGPSGLGGGRRGRGPAPGPRHPGPGDRALLPPPGRALARRATTARPRAGGDLPGP